MSMTLTVLTCDAGRTSGYLLEHESRHILVDCGPGVSDHLQSHIALDQLDAVVVTHAHADHCLDLMGLAYALRFPAARARPLPLYVPAEMTDLLGALDAQFGVPTLPAMRAPITQGMTIHPLDLADTTPTLVLEDLQLTVRPAQHAVPSAALRFHDTHRAVAFSSDTGLTPPVTDTAAKADLFVCEATYLNASPAELTGHGHLTPDQAAAIAADADVRHLLLTHLSRPSDGREAHYIASEHYDGPIDIAKRGARWTVA